MRAQNPVLRDQVFILHQKLLVHHSGDIRQQPRYLRFLHRNALSYSWCVFNRFGLFDHTATWQALNVSQDPLFDARTDFPIMSLNRAKEFLWNRVVPEPMAFAWSLRLNELLPCS